MANQTDRLIELLQYFDRKLAEATPLFMAHFVGKDEHGRNWLCAKLDEETGLQCDEVDKLPQELQEDAKLYFELDSLCCGELIARDGKCNWANHNVLCLRGYRVVAGEKDDFGWLTGVVVAANFRYCYG